MVKAHKAKNDEFYTQLTDIEKELSHYRAFFKDKTVLCNCDDPFESNFFKYFAMNFNHLGLKKLICTCYDGSPVSYTELKESLILSPIKRKPYKIEITEVTDMDGDGAVDMVDVELLLKSNNNNLTILDGDGDFRSEESIEFLKEADVVVTNPPFSLFRQYVELLKRHKKSFILLGNMNSITYKEFFPYLMNNEIWIGYGFNMSMVYRTPYPNKLEANRKFVISKGYNPDDGYVKVPAISWFTNIDIEKRHEPLIMYRKYSENDYPRFDNYDAINVDRVTDIPDDYYDTMGVPITFLDKYNPEQFEIIGITKTPIGSHLRTKIYDKQIQIAKNGARSKVSKLNDGPAIEIPRIDNTKVCYEVDGKIYYAPYARILIRRRKHEN